MNPFRGLEKYEPSIGWCEDVSMWIVTSGKLPTTFGTADPDFDVAVEMFKEKLENSKQTIKDKDVTH